MATWPCAIIILENRCDVKYWSTRGEYALWLSGENSVIIQRSRTDKVSTRRELASQSTVNDDEWTAVPEEDTIRFGGYPLGEHRCRFPRWTYVRLLNCRPFYCAGLVRALRSDISVWITHCDDFILHLQAVAYTRSRSLSWPGSRFIAPVGVTWPWVFAVALTPG